MRAAFVLALCGLLTAARCPGPAPTPPPPPPQLDEECQPPGFHRAFVGSDTMIYRQGTSVRVTPMVDMAPFGTKAIPLRCTTGWSVTGPARLSADKTVLAVDPDAAPGSIVTVGFIHDGAPATLRFRVVGRDTVVLTGTRSQRSIEGCSVSDPIGELEFRGENRFSVTFYPFETYRDYWGSYSFDPATGALRLTVEGGNFIPMALDLEGRAEIADGRLVLTDMFLGSRHAYPPEGSCTYRF
ncbi:hypothetical protein [Allosphingosinicella sp.]|jgi:hypothetical protein|uniref:hypothetical protein n=1 Tax=Allosphingosinicella sp. TaxID=2823234 RepID=UPI002EE29C25